MKMSNLMDRLEALVSSGKGVPATGKVLIDREKLAELISQINASLPADLQEAQDFLQMRENLINQALLEARRIRSSSEEEARARVTESEIIEEANKLSEEIIGEAQRRAQRILDETVAQVSHRRAEADEYAQVTLRQLEEDLNRLLNTVRRGIDSIEGAKEPSV